MLAGRIIGPSIKGWWSPYSIIGIFAVGMNTVAKIADVFHKYEGSTKSVFCCSKCESFFGYECVRKQVEEEKVAGANFYHDLAFRKNLFSDEYAAHLSVLHHTKVLPVCFPGSECSHLRP